MRLCLRTTGWLLVLLAALLPIDLLAQPTPGTTGSDMTPRGRVSASAVQPAADRRVALVIGNDAYQREGRLQNAVRDAELVAEALQRAAFTVTLQRNLANGAMRRTLQEFGRNAAGASIAVLYFAGHGMSVEGRNWLLPIDATIDDPRHMEDEAVSAMRLSAAVEGARTLRLVILDACRNNPFAEALARRASTRQVQTRGLNAVAEADLGANELIAFAARDGQVALDGPQGSNGPFAVALSQTLAVPGLEIGLLFRRVRDPVLIETGRRQEPFTYGSLGGQEVYLVPPSAGGNRPAQQTASPPPAVVLPVPDDSAADLIFWQSVQTSRNANDFEEYLRQFPQGRFAGLARNRVLDLGSRAAPVQPAVMTRADIVEAQRLLTDLGFDTGAADGVVGPRSREALRLFALAAELPETLDFTGDALARLREPPSAGRRAEVLRRLAEQSLRANDSAMAVRLALAAHTQQPPTAESQLLLGRARLANDDTTGARDAFAAASRLGGSSGTGREADRQLAALPRPPVVPLPAPLDRIAAPGRAGWTMDTRTGCRMWNAHPQPRESVSWSGPCEDGVATGSGVVEWRFGDGKIERYQGAVRAGPQHG